MTGPSHVNDDVPSRITSPDWPVARMISGWFKLNHILVSVPFLFYKTSCGSLGPGWWLSLLGSFCLWGFVGQLDECQLVLLALPDCLGCPLMSQILRWT